MSAIKPSATEFSLALGHNIFLWTSGAVESRAMVLVLFRKWEELIFGNYLKLFIDELFGWPSTALKQTKMKENQKLINEQNS